MTKSAKSVFIFGLYMVIIGLALLIVPNLFLTPFGIEPSHEVWIRLSGILLMALAVYYILGAKHELVVIMKATGFIRLTIIVFFSTFVVLDLVSPNIILFAVIDFFGGLWTLLMLKKEGHFGLTT